jgi:hypothetical protein
MQGPGDPGEEVMPDARGVSAHGRAGDVQGRQRELMQRTLLEMRGRTRRRLGEAQDADEGEMFPEVMPGGGLTADNHQTGSESQPLKRPVRTVSSRILGSCAPRRTCLTSPRCLLLCEPDLVSLLQNTQHPTKDSTGVLIYVAEDPGDPGFPPLVPSVCLDCLLHLP